MTDCVFQIILIGLISLTVLCYGYDIPKNCELITDDISSEIRFVCTYDSVKTTVLSKIIILNGVYHHFIDMLDVNCTEQNPVVYDILHKLHLGEAAEVKFTNCALPDNASFARELSQINEFTFQNDKYNAIGSFERTHFAGLSKVTKLTIMTNATHELVNDVFDEIFNLENVTIGYNMKNFNTNVFAGHKSLQSLGLIGNQLDRLTERSFQGVFHISELRLVSNDIRIIDSDAFAPITKLDTVFLSGNRIAELPTGLFSNNSHLRRFDMFCKEIKTLPDELFARLQQLKYVSIRCNMKSVPSNLFIESFNIEEIDLSFNELTTVPLVLFENVQLNFVNFDHNLLTRLPDFEYVSIKQLKLSNNRFTRIDNALNLDVTVEDIDLSNNRITKIYSSDFDYLLELKRVNLAQNLITEVEIGEFYLLDKKYDNGQFVLNGNPFNCSCNKISQIIELKRLNSHLLETTGLECVTPANMTGRDVSSIQYNDLLCGYNSPSGCNASTLGTKPILILNCSNAKLTEFPNLLKGNNFGFDSLELYIDNNHITTLPDLSSTDFSHVTKIIARNNLIEQILPENFPMHLTTLDLTNNRLSDISSDTITNLNNMSSVQNISFGGNPWSCDCELNMTEFILIEAINDLDDIKCKDGKRMMDLGRCATVIDNTDNTTTIIITASIALLAATLTNQETILIWLYAHNICLWCISENELDRDKQYDAFLCSAHQDDDFVFDHLLPELEHEPNPFRICWHERDWPAGEMIHQQIINSIENSCRTIIVLTPNFLKSIWGLMEFRTAYANDLRDGRVRLIVILYEDVGNVEDLDAEVKAYLKTNTYLKWGDPRFFDKLRYALPHRGRSNSSANEVELNKLQPNSQ